MIRPGARTLYELIVERGDNRILVMYTSSRGRRMLLDCARKHADKLTALTGTDSLDFAKRASAGATMGEWTLRWTGRTQREAYDSRLPWVGDL